MNCYFCNLPATKEMDYHKCNTCNSYNYYYYYELEMVRLYHKSYFVSLNFKYKSYRLYKATAELYKTIYVWQSLPNISPQNIESKINTILAFL